MDKMFESVDKYLDEFSTDFSEEAQKLGEGGKQRLEQLDNWVQATVSKEAYEALTSSMRTADAIKALEELRGKWMSDTTMVPNGNDDGKTPQSSFDEIKNELNDPANLKKYKEDPKYQKDWRARLEMASKNSGVLDKMGA